MDASAVFALLAAEMWFASAVVAGIVVTLLARRPGWGTSLAPKGCQHIHVEAASRLGGAAVFMGFVVAVAIALALGLVPLQPTLPLLIAALPVQAVGLLEDVTHRVPPKYRLVAAACSAALASAFAEGVITRLDLPFVDGWLTYLSVAVPLTCFMVVGACNAFNIIDGNNGLAGGSALLMFLGIMGVAWAVGDTCVLAEAAAMIGALIAFLLWNYPKGKVFLGDAGAYFIGFMYAQLSIQLVARNPGVSAWFVIAVAAYPIAETLFSIYRRKVLRHAPAMQADIQHLHSLLYCCFLRCAERPPATERRLGGVDVCFAGRERRQPQRRANAQVAPRLWFHTEFCLITALLFYHNTAVLIAFTLLYAAFYSVCYRKAQRLGRADGVPNPGSVSPDVSAVASWHLPRINANVLNAIVLHASRRRTARFRDPAQQATPDHAAELLAKAWVPDAVVPACSTYLSIDAKAAALDRTLVEGVQMRAGP